jgi:hypothetical protein
MKNLMLKYIFLSQMIIIASVGYSNNNSTVTLKSQFNDAGDPIPGLDISLEAVSNTATSWR